MQAVDLGLTVTNMTKPKNQLFCRLDGLTPLGRKVQRAKALSKLGLLSTEAVPTFEETTQKAVTFSGAPIAILGLVVEDELCFKSSTGLATYEPVTGGQLGDPCRVPRSPWTRASSFQCSARQFW